ncbi:hypothetical protein CH304_20145 [Rhodococcus sp. 15-649-1-2]|nr:hypothetical protein [Rhodococcus sp. 15-649-1-2]OZE79285.1 hypothetical protein CH304_20145 [Rhodococcus sp. 15-649-1-2]
MRSLANVTAAFEGVVTLDGLDGREVVTVGLTGLDHIEVTHKGREGVTTFSLPFDDAEHVAALLNDFALIARTKHGIAGIEVE